VENGFEDWFEVGYRDVTVILGFEYGEQRGCALAAAVPLHWAPAGVVHVE
jgi:hypothetical protein